MTESLQRAFDAASLAHHGDGHLARTEARNLYGAPNPGGRAADRFIDHRAGDFHRKVTARFVHVDNF